MSIRLAKFSIQCILGITLFVLWSYLAPPASNFMPANACWATTYYVDATNGKDTNSGFSASAAWKTITKVNESRFVPGDQILFNRREIWRETLVPPLSGTPGHPILFGAYGTGVKPIISGADLITPGSSWSQSGTWSSSLTITPNSDKTMMANLNLRNVVAANSAAYSGTQIRLTVTANSANNTIISGMSIGVSTSGSNFDAAPTRITFDNGSSSTTITAGGTKVSDEITFTFTKTNRHLIQLYYLKGAKNTQESAGANLEYYNWAAGSDLTTSQNMAAEGSAAVFNTVSKIEVYNETKNTWKTAATTEPKTVLFNGVLGQKKKSLTTVRDWNWSSNILYVYSTSDPNTAYTSPGIEAGKRSYCIDVNGKDYITIDGLVTESANAANIMIRGVSDHSVVQNMEIRYSGARGITWYGTSVGASNYINNCLIHHNYEEGIYVWHHTGSGKGTESYIQNNEVYNNTTDGISIFGGSYIIIQNNDVHDNGTLDTTVHDPAWWIGIHLNAYDYAVENVIIRYNKVYNQIGGGQDGGGIIVDLKCNEIDVYYNICYNNDGPGIGSFNASNVRFYNNVSNKNMKDSGSSHLYHAEISIFDDYRKPRCAGIKVKNNIAYAQGTVSRGIFVNTQATVSTGLDISNNIYYCPQEAGGAFYSWGDTGEGRDLLIWNAFTGVRTDLNSDPQFDSPAAGNFNLRSTSLAIDAGADVGLRRDFAGTTVPIGAGVDIGAYEYDYIGLKSKGPTGNNVIPK